MRKPKEKQEVEVHESQVEDLLDRDLYGEDGWILVKKQRVSIVIPPLPNAGNSNLPDSRRGAAEIAVVEEVRDKSPVAVETVNVTRSPIVDNEDKVSLLSMRSELVPHTLEIRPIAAANDNSSVANENVTMRPRVDKQDKVANRGIEVATGIRPCTATNELPKAKVATQLQKPRQGLGNTLMPRNRPEASTIIKTVKRLRLSHGLTNILDGRMILNQRLRASLLDRKLRNAGGLSKWLASLGLGQFTKIFQGKIVSKFQLANLTMKKLKDMGANAVGPRRKLMHAIECICQP